MNSEHGDGAVGSRCETPGDSIRAQAIAIAGLLAEHAVSALELVGNDDTRRGLAVRKTDLPSELCGLRAGERIQGTRLDGGIARAVIVTRKGATLVVSGVG